MVMKLDALVFYTPSLEEFYLSNRMHLACKGEIFIAKVLYESIAFCILFIAISWLPSI